MIQHSNRRLAALFLASDLIATLVALAAAYWLRFDAEIIPVTKGVPAVSSYLRLFPYIAVVWPLVYYFHGLYQVRRSRSSVEEGLAVLVATALATLLLIGIATFSRGFDYSRAVLVLFFATDVLFVFAGRTAIRRYLEEAWRHGYGVRRVLVVGAGRLGRAVVDKLADHPEAGLRSVGFVDDDLAKRDVSYRGVPVIGPTSDVARVVEEKRVDAVFLALPLEAHRTMLAVLKDVARTVADVRVVPDLLQHITFRAGVEDLDGLPVVHLTQVPLTGWMSLLKMTLDLAIAGTALVLLSPLFAVIALAIRLSEGPPVLYRQQRMGLDGRPFEIVKFRSMREGRVTRVGRLLRATGLDELPQFLNILHGDLSAVGPRPVTEDDARRYGWTGPSAAGRWRVNPGLTGLGQLAGRSPRESIGLDRCYARRRSIAFDCRLIAMSFVVNLLGKTRARRLLFGR